MDEKTAHRRTGPYRSLEFPWVYRIVQGLVTSPQRRRRFLAKYAGSLEGKRIADVGCGTGSLLEILPGNCRYVGIDLNPDYIRQAKKQYPGRGDFHCVGVEKLDSVSEVGGEFDVIFAFGLLHHLEDAKAECLLSWIHGTLAEEGFFLAVDPAFVEGQSRLAAWLIARDRGRAVRTPRQYRRLCQRVFPYVEGEVSHDLNRIPYSHFISICRRTPAPRSE